MQPARQSIPDDIRISLSGIYNVINLLQSKLPMTSYIQTFLAVARHENESVDYYAKICGCSSGAMSKRLNELARCPVVIVPRLAMAYSKGRRTRWIVACE
jgi:hypothetical protein